MSKSYPKTKKGTEEKQTLLLSMRITDTRSFCAKILTLDYLGSIEKRSVQKDAPLLAKFHANEYPQDFSTDVLALSQD